MLKPDTVPARGGRLRLPLLARMLLLLLPVVVVPLIVVGAVSIRRGTDAVEQTAEQTLQIIASTAGSRLDQVLAEVQKLQVVLATTETVVKACSAPPARRKDLLSGLEQWLKQMLSADPDIALAYVADDQGVCIVSTSPNMVGRDYRATREYMRRALKGENNISDLAVGITTREPGVFLAGPVRNQSGSLVGVIVLKLKGEVIDRVNLEVSSQTEKGFAVVIDANGVVISHPDPGKLYHSLGTLSPEVLQKIDPKLMYGIERIESGGLDDLARSLSKGQSRGYLTFIGADGLPRVAGYSRMTRRPWTVAVVQPRSQFDRPMSALAAAQRWWIAGMALLAALGAVWITYRLLRPIRALGAAATKAAEGDWSARAEVYSNDEFGDLARTFNAMMPAIQERSRIEEDLRLANEVQRKTQEHADQLLQQKEALSIAEERVRQILESAAEGIFGVDTEGTITFVNPSACRSLGFTAEEMIGRPSHQLIHHHHKDGSEYRREDCPMYAAYTRGEANRVDNEFLWRKDGSGMPAEYGATPIRKDGKVVGAVISFFNITLRKKAEEALAASERKTRRILETSAEGFWLIDNSTATVDVNPAMCVILGRPREEVLGKSIFEFTDEENTRIFKENIARRARGESGSYEVSLSRPDGSLIACQVSATPLMDDHGVKVGSFALLTDITERKKMEMELKEKMADLERFNRLVIGREERMIQLKEEINGLMEKLGQEGKYKIPQ